MKKYIGKKWMQLTQEQQYELMKNANVWDNIKEGDCIVDLTNDLSVSGSIVDGEIVIDNESIIYNPTEGIIVENEKFKDLISLKDAASMFNKEESTLRRNISNGFFKEWQDCIKFGTTWVFDVNALEKKYGKK